MRRFVWGVWIKFDLKIMLSFVLRRFGSVTAEDGEQPMRLEPRKQVTSYKFGLKMSKWEEKNALDTVPCLSVPKAPQSASLSHFFDFCLLKSWGLPNRLTGTCPTLWNLSSLDSLSHLLQEAATCLAHLESGEHPWPASVLLESGILGAHQVFCVGA